ncbi:MAG: hypothetical protein Q8K18_18115 [Burkholderiales bacterium]|nr:hypothetical protein [Burkholderiales bacterium]
MEYLNSSASGSAHRPAALRQSFLLPAHDGLSANAWPVASIPAITKINAQCVFKEIRSIVFSRVCVKSPRLSRRGFGIFSSAN